MRGCVEKSHGLGMPLWSVGRSLRDGSQRDGVTPGPLPRLDTDNPLIIH